MKQGFFHHTLAARLFVYTSLAAIVGVIVVAFVISLEYRRNAERRVDDILTANLYNLMGNVEFSPEGKLTGSPNLGDSRYNIPGSGWYWQIAHVTKPDIHLSSSSLTDATLSVAHDEEFDSSFQRATESTDASGNLMRVVEARVFLGDGDDLFNFTVTVNKGVLDTEITAFTGRLILILSIFALSIILATYVILRLGLRPLNDAVKQLAEIRLGRAEQIEGNFPDEVLPLIDETNALIVSNSQIVERARTQVGNLAHSLKTPLSVLKNEIAQLPVNRQSLFAEQTEAIAKQVQLYLDRARISARSQTSIASSEIVSVIEKLGDVVARLNPSIDVDIDVDNLLGSRFAGEEPDLQEVFGNLLENAAKYATASIRVRADASFDTNEFTIHVEDDGPGMTESQMQQAVKRGGRVDEGKSGWGLGLSIVSDIAEEYSGEFRLAGSELGGLKASVSLPSQPA